MANEPRTTPLLLLLLLIFPAAGATRPPFACDPRDRRTGLFPFCKTSLPVSDRVSDLIRRLTLPEKISLLVDNAAPVERLGIQAYEWWSEALHGVSNVGPGTRFAGNIPRATSFPQVILTAASFNSTLWEEIGRVVSTEGRAMYNTGLAGLTFWSPNVNIFRDPRWGRGQETPGEDPAVAGKYAASYVRGLQQSYGKDGSRLKVAACCKHYTAYDLDNWRGTDRFHFNAQVSKQDLKDTYEVPFKTCVVEGKVASVMCSYNQVNGVPTCADRELLLDTVRHEWGLNGYIVSDCDSVGVFYDSQHYTRTPEDAAATAIKAGLDLDCGPFLGLHTQAAVQQGKVSEMEVEFALRNTIAVQMRLGMFDGDPAGQPFGQLGPNDICTPANRQLAHETAKQGIVLLKNLDHALPLPPPRYRTLAVIGPNADATVTMIGNYAGIPCRYTSPLKGIGEYTHTIHQPGCSDVACNQKQLFDAAVEAARNADATVMVMGLDQSIEAENIDRESLLLPGYQEELVNRVSWASKGPTILVLMCGGPVDVSFAKRDPRVHAILWVGYPGEAGGRAIADVIFGQHNPGGKLPTTWYREDFVAKVPMTSMDMRADPSKGYPGRTHRFYNGEPVFSFGQGMSYTNFAHSLAQAPTMLSVPLDGGRLRARNITHSRTAVRVTHARCDGLTLQVNVDVKNTGPVDGSHVVFIFSTPPPGHGAPSRQLVAFERLNVLAGAQRQVQFAINVCRDLSIVDVNGIRRLPIGDHGLQIGDLTHSVSLQVEA